MKKNRGIQSGVAVTAFIFLFIQCVPYGFSANRQQALEAVLANPTPAQAAVVAAASANHPAAAAQVISQVQAASHNTTTGFLSQNATLSAPQAAAAPAQAQAVAALAQRTTQAQSAQVQAAAALAQRTTQAQTAATSQANTAAQNVIANVQERIASNPSINQAAASQVISQAQAALSNPNTTQSNEVLQQIRAEVQNVVQPATASSGVQTIQYGQTAQTVGTLAVPRTPSGAEPAPVVILIHGGSGDGDGRINQDFVGPAGVLMSNGYAVFSIDYTTGHVDNAVSDALQAINWVEANAAANNLDANSIGVVGVSYGATIASFLATQHSDQIDCAVAFSPAADLSPVNADARYAPLAATHSGDWPVDSVSPSTAPTLVFNGTEATGGEKPGFQASGEAFGNALIANGVGQHHTIPNGSHGSNLMTQENAPETIQFLDSNLKRKPSTYTDSKQKTSKQKAAKRK